MKFNNILCQLKIKIIVFLLVAINLCCDGAKIMGIIPTSSVSHQIAFNPLWRELSLRGHQVTVLTTDPIKDPLLVNLTEIDVHFSYEKFSHVIDGAKHEYLNGLHSYLKAMINLTEYQLKHPQLQKIIQDPSQKFDVLLIETLLPTYFGLGERFKCPMIGISSLESPSMAYRLLGSPTHPLIYPEILSPYAGELTFYERFLSTFFAIGVSFVYRYYTPDLELVARKHIGIENLDLTKAMNNVEMLFITNNPILNDVRPLTPNVIEIGGGNHFKPPQPLPKEIKIFLDNAKEGFIYFSLGSNAKSKDLPKSLLNTFLQTFAKLPYKILWKYEEDKLPGMPSNVFISKWLPQQDVLRHPNIKLFVYQCGWQSTEESLFSGVPVLGIPMLGDQGNIARIVKNKGMGLSLDKATMTEESLRTTILELIDNPKYRKRVKELSNLVLDQPMTGLEKAVWWTEYVIRNKGANHFKNSAAINIPLYQYLFLDVIGFCISVIAGVIFLLYILFKFVYKTVNCLAKSLKLKSD